jgi:hypothetical protein
VLVTATEDERRDRQQEITAVVLKVLGVAISVGLVIGIGAWVMVKGLGLDSSQSSGSGPSGVQPHTSLPTTALPVPSESSSPGSPDATTTTPAAPTTGALLLSASPVLVKPMERINLTGQWPGHDNESLLVQRLEGGQWTDFGVDVRVDLGTFATYVMTGRAGDQRFRVFDPASQTASNEVTVTVGS